MRSLPLTSFAALALLLTCPACISPGGYAADRVLDLSDVIDVQYGTGMGVGALVGATIYLEAGLGGSSTGESREWFGRRSVTASGGGLIGVVFFTSTGYYVHGSPPTSSADILFLNILAIHGPREPPLIDRFRIGGKLFLPFVNGGLYFNTGEVLDFLAGISCFDPAADDGIPKSDTFEP